MQKPEDLTLPSDKYPTPAGVGRVLLWTILIYMLASVLGQFALTNWALLLGELLLLLPAWLYLRRHHYNARAVFRLNPVSRRVAATSLLLGFAITLLGMELDHLMNFILPFPEQMEALLRQTLRANNLGDWIVIILAAVIFAGAFEEMLFRGFVQNAFEQRHSPLFAVFVTAVLFGAVHLSPWWFVQLIFIAMFLGVLAWKSDSIIPSVLVHAQNNFISVLLSNIDGAQDLPWLDWNGHLHPILLISALAIVAVGLRFFFRFCEEDIQIPTLLNTPLSATQR